MPCEELGSLQCLDGFRDSASSTVCCHGNGFVGWEAPARTSVMKAIKESSEDRKSLGGDDSIVFSLIGSMHQGFSPVQDPNLGFSIQWDSSSNTEKFLSLTHV